MLLTVIPSRATSRESVFRAETTAVRNAFDSTSVGIGCFTATDSSATMRPKRRARIPGRTASTSVKALFMVSMYAASQSAGCICE